MAARNLSPEALRLAAAAQQARELVEVAAGSCGLSQLVEAVANGLHGPALAEQVWSCAHRLSGGLRGELQQIADALGAAASLEASR